MTGNPALNQNTFTDVRPVADAGTMTIQGTVNKASILLVLLTAAAAYTWSLYDPQHPEQAMNLMPWVYGGAIAGLVFALVTSFKKEWSPVTAPVYAICEGLFIGGLSSFLDAQLQHGIVLQAVMLTLGVLAALLGCYKLGLIKATDNFKRGVFAATGAICLLYLVTMVMGFFHVHVLPSIYGNGAIGIAFSVVVVIIAAMNLVIDFDFIEQGAQVGAPKYMEWYAAFGLLVTLVWLYLEILRLLAKLNSRRN